MNNLLGNDQDIFTLTTDWRCVLVWGSGESMSPVSLVSHNIVTVDFISKCYQNKANQTYANNSSLYMDTIKFVVSAMHRRRLLGDCLWASVHFFAFANTCSILLFENKYNFKLKNKRKLLLKRCSLDEMKSDFAFLQHSKFGTFWQKVTPFYLPSSGIASCVGTMGMVTGHLHLTRPCRTALGRVLIWGLNVTP